MLTSELISVLSFPSIDDNDNQNIPKMLRYFVHLTWPKGDLYYNYEYSDWSHRC